MNDLCGLVSDRVFGCHLSTLCEREGTTVPKFVQICLDAVEKRGTFAHRRVAECFLSDVLLHRSTFPQNILNNNNNNVLISQ